MSINFKHQKIQKWIKVLFVLVIAVILCLVIWTRIKPKSGLKLNKYMGQVETIKYPDTDFAVMSDIHYYDSSLGISGAAFEKSLASDRKMLTGIETLLDTAISEIIESDVRFVLIAGDLTKDGERINHERVSEKLSVLTQNGINVYVVPGNHDINNYHAKGYEGDMTYPVESVDSNEFTELYREFGYGDAIMLDECSLSYVAEPVAGLWILAIDSNRYDENTPGKSSIVSGRISQGTADWIEEVLNAAISQNSAVIVLMHHGLVEHWNGQLKFSPDYVIEDHPLIGAFLASYNVSLAFTGHYHAQDITRAVYNGKSIYDIETCSLATSPCPIRFCSLRDGVLSVSSMSIAEKLGEEFKQKAEDFLYNAVFSQAKEVLTALKVAEKDSEYMASVVSKSFAAHYSGDEDLSGQPQMDTGRLGLWARIIYQTQKYFVDGLWEDLPPDDNDLIIDLN